MHRDDLSESSTVAALPDDSVCTVVTYLEMLASPGTDPHSASDATPGWVLGRLRRPEVPFYRELYRAVGEPWHWWGRRVLGDEALREVICAPTTEIHLLRRRGQVAGFCELDFSVPGDVEIVYFGLKPDFLGNRLGGLMMGLVLRYAWARRPRRVWLHTCTLDHPRAVEFYRRYGFRPYREATDWVERRLLELG